MVATVMGKMKKPYNVNGKSGISCRLSLYAGEYPVDERNDVYGSGDRYFELKCSVPIADAVEVDDDISFEADSEFKYIKSAMIKIDVGNGQKAFVPIGN